MKKLFKRNYDAVVKRGLINDNTNYYQFSNKILEEAHEVHLASIDNLKYNSEENIEHYFEEVADTMVVCINTLIHFNIDIEEILTKIAEKNENRIG